MPTKNQQLGLEHLGIKPYKQKKTEPYMSEQMLAHFRDYLQVLKKVLMEGSDRTKEHMQDEAEVYSDPLDRARREEAFNLELRTRDRERKLIHKIDEALEQIRIKEYGYCVDCGAEIGLRRLEARPTATQCVDCKTFDEIREKQGMA